MKPTQKAHIKQLPYPPAGYAQPPIPGQGGFGLPGDGFGPPGIPPGPYAGSGYGGPFGGGFGPPIHEMYPQGQGVPFPQEGFPNVPSAPGESGLLSNLNFSQLKGMIDRLGGLDGIINTVNKVNGLVKNVQQIAPVLKLLAGTFGAKKTEAVVDTDDASIRPPRRRRTRTTAAKRNRSGSGRRSSNRRRRR